MSKDNVEQNGFWVFSNKSAGTYDNSDWDMSTILYRNEYYFAESEGNRAYVRPGDVVAMRIYGESYIGKFRVSDDWKPDPEAEEKHKCKAGHFPMNDVDLFRRPVPQSLIMGDLASRDLRSRIVKIQHEDIVRIDTAAKVYDRLGFGSPDEEIIVLEEGLEEAIKPNLARLGLKPADDISQQHPMGPDVGRSDLVYVDGDGNLVVIELKRGNSSDAVVGQILRYIGYLQENVAEDGQEVRGWIVTGDYDESLRLAAKAAAIRIVLVRLP